MSIATFDHSAMRKGHDALVNGPLGLKQIETYLSTDGRQGKTGIAVESPTRTGKGVQMRHVGVIANTGYVDSDGNTRPPIASLVVMVSPTSILSSQVLDNKKYKDTFSMLLMDHELMRDVQVKVVDPKQQRVRKEDRSHELLDDFGRVKIISVTSSFLLARIDEFVALCKQRKQETGLPVMFMVDEAQRFNEQTESYIAIDKLDKEAGVTSICFTATPHCQNGGKIWNFNEKLEATSTDVIRQYAGVSEVDPKTINIDVIERQHSKLRQQGDIVVQWDEAFEKEWLCKLRVNLIDVSAETSVELIEDDCDAELYAAALKASKSECLAMKCEAPTSGSYTLASNDPGAEGEVLLSQFYDKNNMRIISGKLARKIISCASRDPETIRHAVKAMLGRLQERRCYAADTKAVVFGGNDRPDDSDNGHLELIKRIIAEEWGDYFPNKKFKPMILTMKDDSIKNSAQAIEKLKHFEDEDYDVILLKQMAAEGWDTKKTKVCLQLTDIRSYNFIIQSSFRVATPWQYDDNNIETNADLICLADPFFLMFADWLESSQGPLTKRTASTKIGEETKERKDGPKREQVIEINGRKTAGSFTIGGDGKTTGSQAEMVAAVRRQYPAMNVPGMTDLAITTLLNQGAFKVTIELPAEPRDMADPFEDQGERKKKFIGKAQDHFKANIARACAKLDARLGDEYGRAVSLLAGHAAKHHNRKHPGDGVSSKFSMVRDAAIAERFLATASMDAWGETAIDIVRRLMDAKEVA